MAKCPNDSKLKEKSSNLAQHSRLVSLGPEVKAAGASSNWSHGIHNQKQIGQASMHASALLASLLCSSGSLNPETIPDTIKMSFPHE